MRISFEVDDLLVPHDARGEIVVPWYWRWRYPEPLRPGTRALLLELQARHCEIWIYTTSYRRPRFLRGWFKTLGVNLTNVVNQDVHDQHVKPEQFAEYTPSKYPPAFGIDLHVDVAEGLALEAEQHGFRVLIVAPTDRDWATRVLAAVEGSRADTG